MKNIANITEKRVLKMKKDDVLFPLGYLFYRILQNEKVFCMETEVRNLDNRFQCGASRIDEPVLRGLECRYPGLISVNMCADLESIDIYDFNALVRAVEKDRPDMRK